MREKTLIQSWVLSDNEIQKVHDGRLPEGGKTYTITRTWIWG